MTFELEMARLLRWRSDLAEHEAPPPPSGRMLLEQTRPWWERWPERLAEYRERLQGMRLVYAHAASDPSQTSGPYPVPVLLVRVAQELEASASILHLSVRNGRLRLRFRLDGQTSGGAEPSFDVTFVGDDSLRPILSGKATLSVEREYHLEAELPEELEIQWSRLRVTDRMPFQFILHPGGHSE